MSVDSKVPEIRFKGFSGEWENKKIGRILAEIKRPIELMDNASYQLVTVKRRNEGVVPRVVLKGKNILVKNYFSVKAGDYLISKRQVVHGANGIVPDNLDGAVVSNEYLVVTDSDDITARYWTVISIRPEMHKLFFVSSYGVDIEKLVFDVTDWKNRTIVIPQVTEQKNITDYFQKLDALINQHQQKHDKLSNIKKAMLEKMFPKQGETIPEIRFKGFSGEWNETVLSEVADKYDNLRVAVTARDRIAGNTPYYGANGIQGYVEGYTHDGEYVLLAEDGANNLKNYPIHYVSGKVWVNNHAHVLKAKEDNSNIFLKYALNNIDFEPFLVGGGRAKLNASIMMNLTLTMSTNIKEQTAIGNYFQKLDALINQHQQQIAKLNNIKQACLSKMFI
ncbi:restriction modification system DNA specificity subunit [Yersinia pseudotuberculosis]|uniref:restriction endonuclease subunit S n=1 Tax=Yersinia pseudotuberculosis TaxID=633 RepID=UPI0005E156C4|nr:restriction endonuclease subunit S [Yersinia pseudotuberculosis]CNH28540.1 restriction modification system DNA specificity subunit [Yersinia pseudotuberculosis]CNH30779.1 restriction modification system DNA specificity subunit [Yersinia pseudotuberculosis]